MNRTVTAAEFYVRGVLTAALGVFGLIVVIISGYDLGTTVLITLLSLVCLGGSVLIFANGRRTAAQEREDDARRALQSERGPDPTTSD